MDNYFPFDAEKKLNWSLSSIDSFCKEMAFEVTNSLPPIKNCLGVIERVDETGFECKILCKKLRDVSYNQNPERYGIFDEIILENSGRKYLLPKNAAREANISISSPFAFTLKLHHFQSGLNQDFENKSHRLIIPVKQDVDLNMIEFKSLKIGESITVSGLIDVSIDKNNYQLFKYKNDDANKNYLIIDALERKSFEEFKRHTDSIILGFGYVTGDLFLDEYYYLTFEEKNAEMVDHICYEKKQESVLTNNSLLDPIGFIMYMEKINQKSRLKELGTFMKGQVFSKLCEIINSNEVFSRCCQLRVEASSTFRPLLRAGIYSIALETLTSLIYEENKEKINPIQDPKLASLIKEKFKVILDEYEEFISPYGMGILNSKLNDINRPTNSKKLSIPFKIYNLNLTKEDLKILNHRNKFLHGSSPDEAQQNDYELRFIVARIQFMFNALLLRFIGYSGHLVNQSAWMEYNTKKTMSDHPFKII